MVALLEKSSYTLGNQYADKTDDGSRGEDDSDTSDAESIASEGGRAPDPKPETELWMTSLLRVLGLRTRLLMELLPMIQQVVTTAERGQRPVKSQRLEGFEMSDAANRWYLQVLDKFGHINDGLARRLGEANRQRYDELRKLKFRASSATLPVLDLEQGKSLFRPATTLRDSGLGTSIITPAKPPASVVSHSSFLSSVADSTSRRVPKAPAAVATGESFECDICYHVQSSIRSRTQWK